MKKKAFMLLTILLLIFFGCSDSGSSYSNADDSTNMDTYPGDDVGDIDDLGIIESEYADSGLFNTETITIPGFVIHYPRDMIGDHPIISWGNGTGVSPSGYAWLLEHLASWGFVVIASESLNTGSGEEMLEGIDYLVEQNSEPGSTFFGMIDTDHIGVTGHSQGGMGTVNAAEDPRVTCSAPLAGAGYTQDVQGPMLLIAGAQDTLVPPRFVRRGFDYAAVPTIFAIAQDMNHLSFMFSGGSCRGYLTAWFMYQLKNDTYAAQAFIGECEICNNPNWEVEKKNFDSDE